jgi:hypothetical protein
MTYKTEWMTDVTSMARIAAEYGLQKAIEYIVDVKEHDLAKVADCFIEGATKKQQDWVMEQYGNGSITLIKAGSKISIPLTNAVDCIRIEPFYFVKDLKETFK